VLTLQNIYLFPKENVKQSRAFIAQSCATNAPVCVNSRGGVRVIKKAVPYALMFFVILTLWQWLFRPEIHWIDNIGVSVAVFLAYLFIEWASKPYKYKKSEK